VNGHTDPVIADTQGIPYEQKTHVYRNLSGRFQLLDECIQKEQLTMGSSRGLACGDLDGDLDTDIIFGNQDAAPGLLQNLSSSGAKEAFLITLIGRTSCRDAIGSTISLVSERSVRRSVFGGGSYLSTSVPSVLVCPGSDHTGEAEITWPSGRVSRATGLKAGRHYIILEPEEGSDRVRVTPIVR